MSASASASPCFPTKRRPRRPRWRLEPWTEATPPLDRRWVFLPSPDRTAARGIARPHPRRTSHRLYPAVHKAEEEKHSVLLFCVAHDQQFLARGRPLPAPRHRGCRHRRAPPVLRPGVPLQPGRRTQASCCGMVSKLQGSAFRLRLSLVRDNIYARCDVVVPASRQLPWTQTEMSRCQHRPAGRGARLLLISRGAAFLGLFLPNSTLCFAMPVLHRCANHGSIGTCVVDDRKLGKPCGPVGEKRKEKTNGDRQSTRQGSRVEFVSTSLDLNLIPSLRGLEKKRCHALPSSLRSCEPSVWCP